MCRDYEVDGVSVAYPQPIRCHKGTSEVQIVRAALEQGLDPNVCWPENRLIIPQPKGGCVLPFYDYGRDVWAYHNTPLHRAIHLDDLESAKLLLERGADVNIYNAFGSTPLFEAVARRRHDAIRLLLSHGADVNKPTVETKARYEDEDCDIDSKRDQYAMVEALRYSDDGALGLLVEAGADPAPESIKPWTALDLALLKRNPNAVDILFKHGSKLPETLQADAVNPASKALRDRARDLLAVVKDYDEIPDDQIPDMELYGTYCQILDAAQIVDKFAQALSVNDAAAQIDTRPHVLLQAFFNALLRETGIEEMRKDRNKHVCESCCKFQSEASSRVNTESPFVFELHQGRDELIASATNGCPVCCMVADLLDHEEKKVREIKAGDEGQAEADKTSAVVVLSLGFGALSVESEHIRTEGELFWQDDLMFAPITDTYQPDLSTASEGAMQAARRWLDDCGGVQHVHCARRKSADMSRTTQITPKRLIQLGKDDEHLRLIDNEGSQHRYCALSYCRGTQPFLTTTKTTRSEHESKIPHDSLPQQFRDAIHVARALGYEYIWIDALCILQDDEDDWSHEAAATSYIFLNAHLTLSSLLDDNCLSSLFRPREGRVSKPTPLNIWDPVSYVRPGESRCLHPMWKSDAFDMKSPLNSRAWALQELVSSRRILWFGEGMLHWECLEGYFLEAYPTRKHSFSSHETDLQLERRIERRRDVVFGILVGAKDHDDDEDILGSTSHLSLFVHWQLLLEEYSRLQLGRTTERLAGFTSISRALASACGNAFEEGVWKGDRFLESMCWRIEERSKDPDSATMNAPSWNWGSVAGEISFDLINRAGRGNMTVHSGATLISSEGARDGAAPAKMTLKTRLCKKMRIDESVFENEDAEAFVLQQFFPPGRAVFFDANVKSMDDCYTMDVLGFPLGPSPTGYGYPAWPNGRPQTHIKLLLQPVSDQMDTFRRVGIAMSPGPFKSQDTEDDEGLTGKEDERDDNGDDDEEEEGIGPLMWLWKDLEVFEDKEIVLV